MTISFLLEMAWKSTAIGAVALLFSLLLRSRSAADRAAVLRACIGLLLVLPAVSALAPALEVAVLPAQELPPPALLPKAELPAVPPTAALPSAAVSPSIWEDPTMLVLLLYLGGVAMVGGRLLAGLLTLYRWTQAAEPIQCPAWTSAMERATGRQEMPATPRLLVSHDAPSPLSWGWRKPVVLIDRDSLSLTSEADAVLAHELAHVARGDWLTLMLARLAVTFFWFNPLVWLVERTVLHQSEEAADREALKHVEPAVYARTLLFFAELAGRPPCAANSIAAGSLGRRVRAIMDDRVRQLPARSRWAAAAVCASLAVGTPVAAMKLVEEASLPMIPALAEAPLPAAPPLPAKIEAINIAPVPAAPPAPFALPVIAMQDAIAVPLPLAAPMPPAPPAEPPTPVKVALFRHHDPAMTAHVIAEAGAAAAEARAHVTIDRAEIDEIRREALAAAAEARRESLEAAAEARREGLAAAAEARREASIARHQASIERRVHRSVAEGLASGARGMEQGAVQMERGAREMAMEARRLQSRDHRERRIAEAAAQGRRLTHEELLEAIPELQEGSREMIEGASEMRRSAQEMRQGGRRS
jgi:bla regulator protein blaR1